MSLQLGQRIREQRKSYDFSAADLAQLARLSGKRIGELEAGSEPTLFEVASIAAALAADVKTLMDPTTALDPKRSVARFRAPFGVASISGTDVRLLAKASEVSRIAGHLMEKLGRESPIARARAVTPVRGNREPWRQGYDLGERARDRLIPGGKPIASVQSSFEALGIHVAFVAFVSKDVESASLYESGAIPLILLNATSDRVCRELSRRAIMAHELCHLLHDGGERDLLAAISREDDHTDIEMRANGFAPSFLAPRGHVSVEGIEPKAVVLQLAYTWGFTYEGAVWHAKNIDRIRPEEADRLVKERRFPLIEPPMEPKPDRVPVNGICDPEDVSPLTRGLVSDLVVHAYADGIISSGRAREILTIQ